MRLLQVVAKDTLRRRRRVLYTALGVAVGVAAVVAVLTVARSGEQRIYSEIDKYGANMTVMPAINDVDLKLGDLRLGSLAVGENYIAEDKLPEIRQIADGAIRNALDIQDNGDIATIAPKLYMNTIVKGTSIMVVGFNPEQERLIKSWWEMSGGRYPEQQNEAILGTRASSILGVDPGDSIAINGQDVTIVGILGETGSQDDYQIFAPLKTVQQAFGKEGLISSMDIRALCSACPVESIADSINKTIPGVRAVAVRQIAETEMNLVGKINRFMLALAGITLVVGGFGVVNTMMASVHERIKDIGIMKAVGASRKQIVSMFIYEAIAVGVVGGIIGYIAGTLLSYVLGPLIFDGLAVSYAPQYLLPALGLAILVTIVASVYPALRASHIRVADSLRSL
ncbi:MAG: ABC transporter permease [Chloroflexi bacterium]|nr:ABC transporter permease [Chloroflexota bacterium]